VVPVVVDPPDAGVDEDDPVARPHQEAAERQLDAAVVADELAVRQPGVAPPAGEAEQVGGGQAGATVVHRVDLESADSHGRRH